jgi:hypothetical protein
MDCPPLVAAVAASTRSAAAAECSHDSRARCRTAGQAVLSNVVLGTFSRRGSSCWSSNELRIDVFFPDASAFFESRGLRTERLGDFAKPGPAAAQPQPQSCSCRKATCRRVRSSSQRRGRQSTSGRGLVSRRTSGCGDMHAVSLAFSDPNMVGSWPRLDIIMPTRRPRGAGQPRTDPFRAPSHKARRHTSCRDGLSTLVAVEAPR